jgi:uncharacterized protein (DUF58 family)
MIPKEILKKVRQIQIRTRHMVSDVFAGQYHSVFKGRGMEFHEVREYVPGDDIRSIDWNVTARAGHPFVKKFVEEREMTVMLLVDISASHAFGSTPQLKKDLAAEMAAVLAFSAILNGDRVGLILFSDEVELYVPPKKGTAHVLRVIREVLYFQPRRRGTRLQPALEFLNRVTTRRCVTFLVSDFRDEGYERALGITARKHDVIGIVVGDQREQAWPPAGLVAWQDAETGERFLVDTSHAPARRMLAAREAGRREAMGKQFRRAGVDTIAVAAGEPYEREFIRFFRMRERRMRV